MTISAAVDSSDSGDDVIVVSERRPTPEQVERARVWQLPDTFYLYEDVPPCPGCRGCEDHYDDDDDDDDDNYYSATSGSLTEVVSRRVSVLTRGCTSSLTDPYC